MELQLIKNSVCGRGSRCRLTKLSQFIKVVKIKILKKN